jgi:hypothetical protein
MSFSAHSVVVHRPPLQGQRLVPDDVHPVDVRAVPDRLKHAVSEAETQHVLHGRHGEEMIDPEHLPLRHGLIEEAVEAGGARQVLAEGLFQDYPAARG